MLSKIFNCTFTFLLLIVLTKNASAQKGAVENNWGSEFDHTQDSLRKELLNMLPNKVLKNSLLQELYLRKYASIENDSVVVAINFNLHGPDCGAPDCFSTDVSFKLKLGTRLVFPKVLVFQEDESGCVAEHKFSGIFKLEELTDSVLIYHSAARKRTLVIFRRERNELLYACYFAEPAKPITSKNINQILDTIDERTYPYMSTGLMSNEYEFFFD